MKRNKGFFGSIQAYMNSARGKTLLNYLYSWGAAIVILGTLFKLTHIAGANLMLFVGMGTEVIVFFFSAFERPYDVDEEDNATNPVADPALTGNGGQPIIINGSIVTGSTGETSGAFTIGDAPAINCDTAETGGIPCGLQVANAGNIGEMDKVTEEYIEQVRTLNEALQRISLQTDALSKNMEEMDTLSRNLTGVNALYEVQLRSAGGQLNAIDQVNEQTRKMAQQIEELNSLYARMIEAMTSNMNRPQI